MDQDFEQDTPETVPANQPRDYMLPNRAYDMLKPTVQVILPGLGTLYYALALIWGFAYGNEVVATCAAIATFLGLFLSLSSKSYNNSSAKYDGFIELTPSVEEGRVNARVNVDKTGEVLAGKKQVLLNVDNQL